LARENPTPMSSYSLTHLKQLEAESIHIIREVAAEFQNPVMLYSIGKDSAVMVRLAQKAFYPGRLPFPLLHVNTTWKFRDMIAFRDRFAKENNLDLIEYINHDGLAAGANPFDWGSNKYTTVMKTEGLKQALNKYGFDAAFGGARRDEEKSRAKERVYSFRDRLHQWDPKNQRPELWNLYNGKVNKGESIRVFPLSNWTELDVWQYIHLENIPIVPLYFAADRPVVERDGTLLMVDDDRMRLHPGEKPQTKRVRFRTLGCYPLTGAIESTATTLPEIIQEMLVARNSERQGRMIDHDEAGSMEQKKREGYF
jgi:sulfate adenylyltransferase subunit 2